MIYIHIPFCKNICNYCDFHHSASLLKLDLHINAIEQELINRHQLINNPQTLYLGGGTPSLCQPNQIAQLINRCRDLYNTQSFQELTLEANPEDLSPEYLDALINIGVNRLSIGIQSFHDEHLTLMNRRHTAQKARQAIKDARQAGFDNITIDLMYGLPFMNNEQWHSNINAAIELDVEHISAYHLTIEPKTIFGKRGLTPVEENVSEENFADIHTMLISAGYEHYEVSNFARPGRRAVHNSGYWQGEAYLGVGASAHSYDGHRSRYWNVSSNKLYLEGAKCEVENLTDRDLHNEYIMTRLRCCDGFRVGEYESRFGRTLNSVDGLLIEDGVARIESANFLISDSVIASLFLD